MGEAIITRRGGGKPTGLYAWAKYSQTVLPFSNSTSWADIGGAIAADINGNVDLSKHWNIGDTKDVTLTTGETIQLQIAGFNHDTYSDGVTAPVSLVMKDCLNTKAQMNSSDYNTGGYPASAMKTWVENNIYNKLPSDLKSIVAPVKKKWYTTYNDANSLTESNYNVWLLSEAEIRNNADLTIGEGEGTKYPIFTYNDASRIKKVNGTASYWWLGSCDKYNSTSFVCVDSDGNTRNGYAITNPMGVAVGLCPRGTTPQLQKTFIEYVVSDNENAYPDKTVHTDGYYYEKVVTGLTPEMLGYTKMAIDTFTFTTDTQINTAINHSLGEDPKCLFIIINSEPTTVKTDRVKKYMGFGVNVNNNIAGYMLYSSVSMITHIFKVTDTTIIGDLGYYWYGGVEYTLITMA